MICADQARFSFLGQPNPGQVEVAVDSAKRIVSPGRGLHADVSSCPAPPLVVASLSLKTQINAKSHQHEVVAASVVHLAGVSSDGPMDWNSPRLLRNFSIVRKLDGQTWPHGEGARGQRERGSTWHGWAGAVPRMCWTGGTDQYGTDQCGLDCFIGCGMQGGVGRLPHAHANRLPLRCMLCHGSMPCWVRARIHAQVEQPRTLAGGRAVPCEQLPGTPLGLMPDASGSSKVSACRSCSSARHLKAQWHVCVRAGLEGAVAAENDTLRGRANGGSMIMLQASERSLLNCLLAKLQV
jgi:hypothetical protein